MNKPTKQTLFSMALAAIIPAAFVCADVPIYQKNISIYGYAAGSLGYTQDNYLRGVPSETNTTFALDAAKVGLAFNYMPVTAKLSGFVPTTSTSSPEDIYLLDVNVTYTANGGSQITFGRFQSWIGYESFDIPNRDFITVAAGPLSLIPTFHEGVKWQNKAEYFSYGIAVLDSLYADATNPYSGDGDLTNGYAIESFVGYKRRAVSLQFTLGYQTDKDNAHTDTWIADLYGEINLFSQRTTIGGEICGKTDEPFVLNPVTGKALQNNRSTTVFGLLSLKHKFSEKFYGALRGSAGHEKVSVSNGQAYYDNGSPVYKGGTKVLYKKYSAVAGYAISKYLDVRLEGSYTDYTNTIDATDVANIKQRSDAFYAGAQLVLKF